ncbi:MAG: hypothetical protein ACI9XR_002114 [Flavobacterium sp.]|jgi:hypothetical protein
MKNLLKSLALTMLVTVSLVSCSKSDDGPSTSGELVGKWEFFQEGASINGQESLAPYEHATGCSKDFLQFTATNVTDTSYDGAQCTAFTDTTPYTRAGNTITLDGQAVTIIQLDGTTLKVRATYSEGGTTVNFISVLKRAN